MNLFYQPLQISETPQELWDLSVPFFDAIFDVGLNPECGLCYETWMKTLQHIPILPCQLCPDPRKQIVRNRAILPWMSKVIRVCFGFALLRLVIGLKYWLAPLSLPMKSKTQSSRSSLARFFPRFTRLLRVLIGWMDCLKFVIRQSDYFCFGFTTLNWKSLYNIHGRVYK